MMNEAPYLFFIGDPVRFEIQIVNTSSMAADLLSPYPSDAFEFKSPRNDRPVMPIALKMTVGSDLYTEHVGPRTPILWDPRIQLAPRQKLVYQWQLSEPNPSPGRYRIELIPHVTDGDGRPVRPQASILDFELRMPSTLQEQADVVLRRGWAAWQARNYDAAERIANDLLQVNPQSYAAYVLKGQIAAQRNKPAEKLEMYQKALTLAESRADPWCARCVNDSATPSLIESLRCLVRGYACE